MSPDRLPDETSAHAPPGDDAGDASPMSDTEALLHAAKRRRMRALMALIGITVAAGAVSALGLMAAQKKKERKLAESYGALGRCLWGEVLAEGQSPGTRVRASQLFTMSIPENKRADVRASPWPMSCSTRAFAVRERLVDAGRADGGDGKALAETAAALGDALKEPKSVYSPIAPMVDRLVEQAARLGINAEAPPDRVPDPPAGPLPLSVDSFEKVPALSTKSIALKSVVAETITDGELRLVLRESDRGPTLCVIGKESTCRALPKAIEPSAAALRFAGTVDEGAAPILLGERDGRGGVFRSDSGEKIGTSTAVYGAFAKKDGEVTLLGFEDKEEKIRLTRSKGAGSPREQRFEPNGNTGNGYYNLGMLWDQVVWKAVKDEQIHMFARKVNTGEDMIGSIADLGTINEPSMVENKEDEEPHVTGCRTPEALIARVKGWSNQFLTFYDAGMWSFPVKVHGRGGTLTCRGKEATITWISERIAGGGGRVHQTRCTSAGCKAHSVKGEDLVGKVREIAPMDAAQTAAADLEGNLLFLWIASSDGDLRMKLAPADKIGLSPDVVLFDPLVQKGKQGSASTLYDVRLFVRGGQAFAVLSTSTGVHAIKIGADGKFAPVAVTR